MPDDKPPPLRRAHRAKRLRQVTGGIDGGAVAVGVVIPLLGFASILVIAVPDWVAGSIVFFSLLFGGMLATAVHGSWATCSICHGMLVGVTSAFVASMIVVADFVAESDTVELELTSIVGHSTTAIIASIVIAVLIGGGGSVCWQVMTGGR